MKNTSIFIAVVALFALTSSIALAQSNVSRITMTSGNNGGSVKVDSTQTTTWETSNFPKDAQVSVNLIKQISSSPVEYVLVRQIATATSNNGSLTWKPLQSDIGDNLFVEVGCSNSISFKDGCVADIGNSKFAIKGTFGSNTAGAAEALIDFINNLLGR